MNESIYETFKAGVFEDKNWKFRSIQDRNLEVAIRFFKLVSSH